MKKIIIMMSLFLLIACGDPTSSVSSNNNIEETTEIGHCIDREFINSDGDWIYVDCEDNILCKNSSGEYELYDYDKDVYGDCIEYTIYTGKGEDNIYSWLYVECDGDTLYKDENEEYQPYND